MLLDLVGGIIDNRPKLPNSEIMIPRRRRTDSWCQGVIRDGLFTACEFRKGQPQVIRGCPQTPEDTLNVVRFLRSPNVV